MKNHLLEELNSQLGGRQIKENNEEVQLKDKQSTLQELREQLQFIGKFKVFH